MYLQTIVVFAVLAILGQAVEAQNQLGNRPIVQGNSLIGEPCMDLSDCVGDWPRVDCSPQKICVCGSDYIQKSDLSDCLPIAGEIGAPCEENQQCIAGILGELSYCVAGQCQCMESAVSDSSRSKCLLKATLVGDPCEIQAQCLPNLVYSSCVNQACVCNDNATPSANRTICLLKGGLNMPCEDLHQCQVPNSHCRSGVCKCAPGLTESETNPGQCVQIITDIGDSCVESIQCVAGLRHGAECVDSRCQCKASYVLYEWDGNCYEPSILNGRCDIDPECIVGVNEQAFCNLFKRRCDCRDSAITEQFSCYRKATQLGDSCDIDKQCTFNLGNLSKCDAEKRCSCVPGSVPDEDNKSCVLRCRLEF